MTASTAFGTFPLAAVHEDRLREMALLTDGWHPGFVAPGQAAFTSARILLTYLPVPVQARFEVYPSRDGGLIAQSVEHGLVFTAEIDSEGAVTGGTYDAETEARDEHTWESPADAAASLIAARDTRASAATQDDPPKCPSDQVETSTYGTRFVGLFCDDGCGTTIEADIVADTTEQAYAGLRRLASGQGWEITADADLCPTCGGGCTAYREYGYRCGLPAGHDPQQDHVNVREPRDGQ